jgi:hypothetical protein
MRLRDLRSLFRTAVGLRRYVKHPLTHRKALDAVRQRMDGREQNFLRNARELVYAHPGSPYRGLLLWAGCQYGDLEASIRRHGIEPTLNTLKDAGVYVSLEEFKSKTPICRKGLTIEASESDFDNPHHHEVSIEASTSGSRSKGVQVAYNWDFLTEEASNELLLYEDHGLREAPLAFWLPVLPCVSGIHNLLMNLKYNKIPDKWFSQLQTEDVNISRRNRTARNSLLFSCRILGYPVPRPEFAGVDEAEKVALWMEATAKKKGICTVRTYASSAVRLVQTALEKGIDISGNVVFTGAEPLTPQRASFIRSAGVSSLTRYVATETGLIGASCKDGEICDDMHIYLDRHAIVQRRRSTAIGNYAVDSYLFTSLLNTVGKVMFNTELGDFGSLTVRPCSCVFGQLGMNVHVAEVRSYDKLTCEGMTLLGSELDGVVAQVVRDAGGTPEDYQFWETENEVGMPRLIIAVSPDLGRLDETRFVGTILKKLRAQNISLASQFWERADTLHLIRAKPEYTRGCKKLPILKK